MTIRPNRARKAKTYERNFGARGEAVREMGCVAYTQAERPRLPQGARRSKRRECSGRTQAAHATPRGMGGAHGGKRDLVNLCTGHHDESGERGTSQRAAFDELYGDGEGWLIREAVRIAIELDERGIDMPDGFEPAFDATHGYEVLSQELGLYETVLGWKTPQEASSAAWERWRELTGWPGGAL